MSRPILPDPAVLRAAPRRDEKQRPRSSAPAGFANPVAALLICHPDIGSILPTRGSDDTLTFEDRSAAWAKWRETQWAKISAALCKGLLSAYAVPPAKGFQPVPPEVWLDHPALEMPSTIQWQDTARPIPFYFRVGDLEWFLGSRDRPVWTTDQTLMWMCTRDLNVVEEARPALGLKRLTWLDFQQRDGDLKVLPLEAVAALKYDLEAKRLTGWAGQRRVSFPTISKWQRNTKDPLSFWAYQAVQALPPGMALKAGETLYAVMLDPKEVQSLYPSEVAASASQFEDDREANEETPSTLGVGAVKATIAGEKRCAQYLAAEMSKSPDRQLRSRNSYLDHCKAEFGISERGLVRAWSEAVKASGAAAWSAGGRPPRN